MKRAIALITVIVSFFISGCATLADAQAARGTGTIRIYDKEYSEVWSAALTAVSESGLALVSENKDKGTILAQRGMTAFSYGENVAIFVERVDGQVRTRVEVVNKRALATNITAADWEEDLTGRLDKKLK